MRDWFGFVFYGWFMFSAAAAVLALPVGIMIGLVLLVQVLGG